MAGSALTCSLAELTSRRSSSLIVPWPPRRWLSRHCGTPGSLGGFSGAAFLGAAGTCRSGRSGRFEISRGRTASPAPGPGRSSLRPFRKRPVSGSFWTCGTGRRADRVTLEPSTRATSARPGSGVCRRRVRTESSRRWWQPRSAGRRLSGADRSWGYSGRWATDQENTSFRSLYMPFCFALYTVADGAEPGTCWPRSPLAAARISCSRSGTGPAAVAVA